MLYGGKVMNYRKLLPPALTLIASLAAGSAHASYVIEADGMGMSAEAGGTIATGADFDFITRDFGIESGAAIQIALTNLSHSTALRGNLLLWPHLVAGHPAAEDAAAPDLSLQLQAVAADATSPDSKEDFSYYDDGSAKGAQDAQAGAMEGDAADVGVALPASVQRIPTIGANSMFWILKPAEFESFSQMVAARFGF